VIIFWILAVFVGASAFSFAFIVLQLGIVGSTIYGLVAMLATRGVLSIVTRALIARDSMAPEADVLKRTVEANRAIFWRRILYPVIVVLAVLGIIALIGFIFLGLAPLDTYAALWSYIVLVLPYMILALLYLPINFLILFGPFYLYTRLGKSMLNPDDANFGVSIDDVRGQRAAVGEMKKILRLIEQGRMFVKAGGKRERGVLMIGPPGTGKTMLAKAIASSLNVPISIANGGSFAGMFLGIDALSVYLMVRAARKKAKVFGGCVVFIDEIDALGTRRSGMGGGGMLGGMMMGGNSMLGLNMLLVLMDGIDNPGWIIRQLRGLVNLTLDGLFLPRKVGANGTTVTLRIPALKAPSYNILFVGATNRPGVMDEALLRPGRFGRQIVFLMPKREERKDIAALYFDKKKHNPALDTPEMREEFARITEDYSPADIEQVLSLALLYAFEEGRDGFDWKDIREAMGNVEMGLALPVSYNERDLIAVARHEVGHAVASHFFKTEHSHVRLSIRRRATKFGEIGGYHKSTGQEDEWLQFRSQLAADVRHYLGSIACEHVFYGENASGVFGDLQSATSIACRMVGTIGMGPDKLDPEMSRKAIQIGQNLLSIASIPGGAFEQGTFAGAVLSSPHGRKVVSQLLGSAYTDCWRLMYVNKAGIDLAVEALIAQGGDLMGNEISGLLDSVGLREPVPADPYPEAFPEVPDEPRMTALPEVASA
jgi:cell division protease FtsH